jgi:carboxyl-terminal processing protease
MRRWRLAILNLAAVLTACGGDSGDSSPSTSVGGGVTTATAGCTLRARQDWAAAQLREWYLFPETLPASLDPTPYPTVQAYVDALTAGARAQRRDRYFTYVTSIREEDGYYQSGNTAGFGIRIATSADRTKLQITEAFEGAPALTAGIDRGTEIVGIGTTASDVRPVAEIVAANGLDAALGPATAGTTRTFRIVDGTGTRDVTVAKADYALVPVSARYGARVLADGDKRVGYINLRTFIDTADGSLRAAFDNFRAQGITEFVIDLRYNGGGLISIAELMGDLMGADRSSSDVFSYTTYRPEKASSNRTRFFQPQAQSVAPTRIAFIGTAASASASELVVNAFIPYLHARVGLIGTNTFGKPVGQIGLDRSACDDRLRVVALATQNAARNGGYYDGLAGTVEASCRATDDLTQPLGSVAEDSIRTALDFLAGRACTPIDTAATAQRVGAGARTLVSAVQPNAAQREVPGLF